MSDPTVLVAGETLVDLFPVGDGPPAERDTFRRRAGGAPANVAVAMARLGSPPRFWTRLGDDGFGEFLGSKLAAEGVPERFVSRSTDAPTALAVVDPDADPGFELYVDGTATVAFDADDLVADALDAVGWVHVGGVLLSREPARSAMLDLVRRAQKRGCTVSFDPNTRPSLWDSTDALVSSLESILESVDVVCAHADDFPDGEYPADAPDLADALLDRGPHTVFVTRGADGADAHASEDSPWGPLHERHTGFDVSACDPTGAGDAFTAACIVALYEDGLSLSETVAFANAAGAATTTETGAMRALPDRKMADQYLRKSAEDE